MLVDGVSDLVISYKKNKSKIRLLMLGLFSLL